MKVALVPRYGGPETLRLVDRPVPHPRKGEVLVRMTATTVNSADARVRAFRLPPGLSLPGRLALGLTGPRRPVLGTEGLGTIAALGPGTAGWDIGQEVVVFPGGRMGAHAEYLTLPASGRIIPRPPQLTGAEAAAMCFGGMTALHYLYDRARLQPGDRLLVIGAAGTVGSAAVQIARAAGAQVTAAASATHHPALLSLGAEATVDLRTAPAPAIRPFDIVMDCVDALSFRAALPMLAPGGRYLVIAGGLGQMLAPLRAGPGGRRAIAGPAPERRADMETLARLAAEGSFRPLIATTFPFDQIARAHALVDQGRKRGSVVLLF